MGFDDAGSAAAVAVGSVLLGTDLAGLAAVAFGGGGGGGGVDGEAAEADGTCVFLVGAECFAAFAAVVLVELALPLMLLTLEEDGDGLAKAKAKARVRVVLRHSGPCCGSRKRGMAVVFDAIAMVDACRSV